MGSAKSCDWRCRDRYAKLSATANQHFRRGIQFVFTLRISFTAPAPGIGSWPSDLQRLFNLLVVWLQVLKPERPIANIGSFDLAIERAPEKIFRMRAHRHHRIVDGASAHSLSGIIRA